MTACSTLVGQGTATKKKRIGKAKCRTQRRPPARQTPAAEIAAAHAVIVQLRRRQSGFASWMRRIGTRTTAAIIMRAIQNARAGGGAGAGAVCQRRQKA